MSRNTSVGRGPASGGNENHDGDPLNKTMGETIGQEPPAGNDVNDDASTVVVPGVPDAERQPGEDRGDLRRAG